MKFRNLLPIFKSLRRPAGDIVIPEDLWAKTNVSITARERGKIVGTRESHNIVVDNGRTWLRGLVAAATYDANFATALDVNPGLPNAVNANTDVFPESAHRPRFLGLGVGGSLQTTTPPGPGAFTEVSSVRGLESPVKVEAASYLAQISGQKDADDGEAPYTMADQPNKYTIRFRRIFLETEVSFDAQPVYGNNVPLSEIGLFHSGADVGNKGLASSTQQPVAAGAVAPGFIAYNTFATLTKTPLIQLEVVWEWRF